MISPLFQRWIHWMSVTKRLSPATLQGYSQDVSHFLQWIQSQGHLKEHHKGGREDSLIADPIRKGEEFFFFSHGSEEKGVQFLTALSLKEFRRWLTALKEKGMSPRSMARALASVRSFYAFLLYTFDQPCVGLSLVRSLRLPKLLPKPLTEDQAVSVVETIGSLQEKDWIGLRNEALFSLLYGVGLRISEALGLTGSILTRKETIVVLGKGNKKRQVPFLDSFRHPLECYIASCPFPIGDHTPLFLGARGGPLCAGVVQREMRTYRRLKGLPEFTTPHTLRHSCATHLMKSSKDLRGIQHLLGHASLSTTQGYTDVDSAYLVGVYQAAHPRVTKKKTDHTHTKKTPEDSE